MYNGQSWLVVQTSST